MAVVVFAALVVQCASAVGAQAATPDSYGYDAAATAGAHRSCDLAECVETALPSGIRGLGHVYDDEGSFSARAAAERAFSYDGLTHNVETVAMPTASPGSADDGSFSGPSHGYDDPVQLALTSASLPSGFFAPQTPGGGGATSVDLYAVGREGGPPFPRSSDLDLDGDDVCPAATDNRGFFRGLSTFASPQDLAANVSGQVWRLPAGTSLPDLAVVADGRNYVPDSPFPSSHHTIYPTRSVG